MTGINIKNFQKEQQLHTNRANIAIVIILALFLCLFLHLFKLQVLEHDRYSTYSRNNRINLVPIPPNRGLIYDRNGVILAQNKPVHELEIDLKQINNLKETIEDLNKIIPITLTDQQKFYELLKRGYKRTGVPIKSDLTEEEMALFAVNRHKFPGVDMNAKLIREYPYGKDLVHILGYVGRINEREIEYIDSDNYAGSQYIGKLGIEKYYEEQLHGHVGRQEVEVNARGRILRSLRQQLPVPGDDLYLTIDVRLQQLGMKLLEGKRGSIVAIDPSNGDVLAMISTPGYDPNLFVNGITPKDYKKLQEDPDRPLFNRSIRGQYPPASTVKPILALYGLASNTISPFTEIYDPGYYVLNDNHRVYKDWMRGGHGYVNLRKAIIQSCDTFFYGLARLLGVDQLEYVYKQFGYGNKTNIDMKEELSGLVPSKKWKYETRREAWYPGETLIAGIGQGLILVTPLQLANAASILANRGVLATPHLLLQSKTPESEFIRFKPVIADTTLVNYKADWDYVISAMQGVIYDAGGTARSIRYPEKYNIAGKTGTAQVVALGKAHTEFTRDHTLFKAFAPVDNPKIAIGVIIENGARGLPTSKVVARKMMDYYLLESGDLDKNGDNLIKFNKPVEPLVKKQNYTDPKTIHKMKNYALSDQKLQSLIRKYSSDARNYEEG